MSRAPSLRRLSATLAYLGVILLTAGCGVGMGSAKALPPDSPIKVGVIPVADFAPIYVAQDEGYFRDEDLNVQTQDMQNAAAIAPSVINGQLQFGTAAVPPFLAAVHKGLPLKAVANGASVHKDRRADHSGLMVSADSNIKRPRDLEGHTVAVNALGSILHLVAADVIEKDSGDPMKVTFVAMPLPDMGPALQRGAIDAASLAEPFRTKAIGEGARAIASPYSEVLMSKGTFSVFFTAGPFAETNPEAVRKFRRAIDRASTLSASHPEKVEHVLAKYGHLPPEITAKMRLPMYTDDLSVPAIKHEARLMQRLDFLSGPVDVEGAVWK